MSADRRAGRYGRRRPPVRHPAIRWSDIRSGAALHYAPVDYLARLGGGWQMLGNDAAGDCVPVTWANTRRLVTTSLTPAAAYYPTQAQVWQVYQTQNAGFDPAASAETNGPGSADDNGMDIQTLLEYLHGTPGPDGASVVAFAAVNHADSAEVDEAVATLGSVWTGINVLACNQAEFTDGEPWDALAGSADEGGHSIITGGYLPGGGPLAGGRQFVTWAQETSFTDAFWTGQVEECWAVIWPEHLGTDAFEAGVDGAALAAAYQQVTGKPLVIPAPVSA